MVLSGTYMTDAVGLDFMKLTAGCMARVLWDGCNRGTPSLIGHDYTRAFGWNIPTSLYFEPGLTRLLGRTYVASNEDERQGLSIKLNQELHTRLEAGRGPELASLKELIKADLKGAERPLCMEAAALVGDGLAERVFPELFDIAARDKDGLVSLDSLKPVAPGVYQVGELLVFAHRFLRRSFERLNSMNAPFLEVFHQLSGEDIKRKIKLDPDTVGLAGTAAPVIERSYWWGPSFKDSISDISPGVHHRESTEIEKFFSQVSGTQFFWYDRDDYHNFEAEELRDQPSGSTGEEYFVCRYAHAMVPMGSNDPDHFDGAVRIYDLDQMAARLDVDLMHAGRQTTYIKLWRIDGKLPHDEWKRLLSDYFRDNTHIGVYLGGQLDQAAQEEPEVITPDTRLAPYSMYEGDGVRVALSFHTQRRASTPGRSVLPTYGLEGEKDVALLDKELLEFSKLLKRRGSKVRLPSQCAFEACNDAYSALPVIHHSGDAANKDLTETLDVIRENIAARLQRRSDFVIAFAVRFPVEEKDVVVSVVGQGAAVNRWLESNLAKPPMDLDGLAQWSDQVADYLRELAPREDAPSHEMLLGINGEFVIRRVLLQPGTYDLEANDIGLKVSLRQPEDGWQPLIATLNRQPCDFALGSLCTDFVCRRCQRSYLECPCCRWLDEGTTVEIVPDKGYYVFWTDRKVA